MNTFKADTHQDHKAIISCKNEFFRMTTFIKTKFKKSDDQTNIERVTANITEYHIISKLIFLRIIIPKFMKKWQLFHVKMSGN